MSLFVIGPTSGQSLSNAVEWFRALLLGSIGTTVAIVAVACVGLLMLSGRVPVRRGATVLLGCFILFSAGVIAFGLMNGVNMTSADASPSALPSPPPSYTPSKPDNYDPYAGASVHIQGQGDLLH